MLMPRPLLYDQPCATRTTSPAWFVRSSPPKLRPPPAESEMLGRNAAYDERIAAALVRAWPRACTAEGAFCCASAIASSSVIGRADVTTDIGIAGSVGRGRALSAGA